MLKRRIYSTALLAFIILLAPTLGLLPTNFFGKHSSTIGKAYAETTNFQAGHIIDDNIFTNSNALSEGQIQTWLNDMVNSVGGCYAPGAKSTNPPNGACINEFCENTSTLQNNFSSPNPSLSCPQQIAGSVSAAQIIYNAAQTYGINPEVILTTLQKEQGLVTDNWPWYSEYQYAMGYSCPDSNGCSTTYADFYKQVDGAAWQFRYYLNNPGAFDYWIGSNTIDYAPGCAGSTIDIQNAATAALYIYTPYQPDSNVLANTNPIGSSSGPGPAINDGCASYGNRNFWWYFNTWFGPSVDTSVYLAEETGTSTYYVVYDNQKQAIPSADVLDSWGLNGLPVSSLDSSIFNAIPTNPTVLTRYVVNTQNNQAYFADNGNVYSVSSNDASVWGFSNPSQISTSLVNFANYQGEIKPYVSESGSSTYYAVDNGALHAITSSTAYGLWAGQNNPPIQISSAYFNTMPQSSAAISSPEFTYNSASYVLSDGQVFSLSSNTASLLPSSWSTLSIGSGLFNTFSSAGALQYMVKAQGSSTVYLLDSGTKRGIPDLFTYGAFQADQSGDTSLVSNNFINSIPGGSAMESNVATIGSQTYVVDQGLHPVPSSLTSAYSPMATSLSTAYGSLLPSASNATAIAKSTSSSAVYFLDNGSKLPFSNPAMLGLVAGKTTVTYLSQGALSILPQGSVMSNYVTNNGSDYLIDQGSAYGIPAPGTANAWGLQNPVSLSSTAISNFPNGGSLSQYIQKPNGQFCLIDGASYCAGNAALLTMWSFGNKNVIKPSQQLLNYLNFDNLSLSPFVSSLAGQTYSGTIFAMAKGQLIGISTIYNGLNLGLANYPVVKLDSYTMSSLMSNKVWQGYLAEDDNGNIWVLDGGIKHSLPSQYQSAWVGSNSPTLLGSDFLSLLSTGQPISNSIKSAPSPTVFGIKNSKEYAIPSPQVYASSGLSPYVIVNPSLIYSIPYAGVW